MERLYKFWVIYFFPTEVLGVRSLECCSQLSAILDLSILRGHRKVGLDPPVGPSSNELWTKMEFGSHYLAFILYIPDNPVSFPKKPPRNDICATLSSHRHASRSRTWPDSPSLPPDLRLCPPASPANCTKSKRATCLSSFLPCDFTGLEPQEGSVPNSMACSKTLSKIDQNIFGQTALQHTIFNNAFFGWMKIS